MRRNWAIMLWGLVVFFKKMMTEAMVHYAFSCVAERWVLLPPQQKSLPLWWSLVHSPMKWQDLSYLLPDSDLGGCRAFIYSLVHSLNKQFWAVVSVSSSVLGVGIAKVIRMWASPSRSVQSWQISGWDRCANRSLKRSEVSSVLEMQWECGEWPAALCPWE